MTITRANGSGWATRDRFTHAQANTIDINTTLAIDGVNGDVKNPIATIQLGGQGLTLTAAGTPGRVQYASKTVKRCLDCAPVIFNGSTQWRLLTFAEYLSPFSPWSIKNLTNSSEVAVWRTHIPTGNVIDKLYIGYKGAFGHGAFPGGAPTYPFATLKYHQFSDNTIHTVTTINDSSTFAATAGAYEAYHVFTTTSGLGIAIDESTKRYFFELSQETGANYIAGGIFVSAFADFLFTEQQEI